MKINGIDYNQTNTVDEVLYWHFVKYDTLASVIQKEFGDSSANTINVYVDIYQIIAAICRCTRIEKYNCIAATLINYAGHLRNFFNKLNVHSKIVLVYSDNSADTIKRFIPGYNKYYEDRLNNNSRIMKAVRTNIELMRYYIPYVNDVFLREGTVEPAVLIHDIIQRKLVGAAPSLVISGGWFMFQLPQYSRGVKVIRKTHSSKFNEDTTFYYNSSNCVEAFIYTLKKKNIIANINQRIIHILMALMGIPKLNIPSVGIKFETALAITKNIPSTYEHDYDKIYEVYLDYTDRNKTRRVFNKDLIINRLKGLDLDYQYSLYKLLPEYNEQDYLTQLDDVNSIHYINNNYFRDCPINLEMF